MLQIIENLLDNKTNKFLQNFCDDFDNQNVDKTIGKNHGNFYNRVFIKDDNLKTYYENLNNSLKNSLKETKFKMLDFPKQSSWINKVITETNKNDDFHYDESFLTAVTYLNNDFEGGSFQYKDENDNVKSITPKPNMTLIMDEKLFHRVQPVKSGVRFSLVTFFQFTEKEVKTLL
jgi:hypothetical protein